tara:strand:+ start:1532 stop:1777 length:246 start_codon:yes stop_codon:yes gene_type:complete
MDAYDNYIDLYLENPENDAERAREKAEKAAKKTATKLFFAIRASVGCVADRFDLGKLAADAIVSAYEEGLAHGETIYKSAQ